MTLPERNTIPTIGEGGTPAAPKPKFNSNSAAYQRNPVAPILPTDLKTFFCSELNFFQLSMIKLYAFTPILFSRVFLSESDRPVSFFELIVEEVLLLFSIRNPIPSCTDFGIKLKTYCDLCGSIGTELMLVDIWYNKEF